MADVVNVGAGSNDGTGDKLREGGVKINERFALIQTQIEDIVSGVVPPASVSNSMLASMSEARIKGRAAAAGTGTPTDLTGSQVSDIAEHVPTWAGAITRTVKDKLRDLPHVYDMIAPADRTTSYNATTALNACLATGERFVLPRGEIRFAGPLVASVDGGGFIGQGGESRLVTTSATNDVFQLGDGANDISNLRFEDFTIWSTEIKSAGWCFNHRFVTDSEFITVRAGSIDDYVANGNAHRLYRGHYHDRFSQIDVWGGEIVVSNDPVWMRGNVDQSFGAEVVYDGSIRIIKSANVAFLAGGGAGGIYLKRVDISECGGGIKFDKSLTAVYNREAFINDDCTIDNCLGWAVNIEDDGLETLDLNAWISGCGDNTTGTGGLRVAPTSGVSCSIKASALRIQSCKYDGVQLSSGILNWTGGLCRSNGIGTNGGHGILLAGGRAQIIGLAIHNNGNPTRGHNVRVETSMNDYTIALNDIFSPGQSNISNVPPLGKEKLIFGNRGGGDAEWTSFTPTVTSGSGTITTVGSVTGEYRMDSAGLVDVTLILNITTNGTGATDIRVTNMPFSAALSTAGAGRRNDNGFGLQGYIGGASSTLVITKSADNGYPADDGAVMFFSIRYRV